MSDDSVEPTPIPPDPRVELQAGQTSLKVGDTFNVVGHPIEIGLPYYELDVRDEGVQDNPPLARITYENNQMPVSGTSQVVDFVSAEASMDQVTFVLRAKAPGVTTVSVVVSGEVHSGGSGPASWNGGASGSILITVIP